MSVRDEVKAEQQRMFQERMAQRKANENKGVANNNDSSQGSGCSVFLLIGFALFVIILIATFGGSDIYDHNDWNFDGKVDYDDAEKKLDWLQKNE